MSPSTMCIPEFLHRCGAVLVVTVACSVPLRADLILGGFLRQSPELVRLDDSGNLLNRWSGPFESVGGFTQGTSGTLYAAENRLGTLAVRGWDSTTGQPLRTLTDNTSLSSTGWFGLPVTLAAGPSGVIYAVGSYFSILPPNPNDPKGTGIVRLHETEFTPSEQLSPWISYGSGGSQNASDLAVSRSGDLYLSDRDLGVLHFSGDSGAYEGLTVPLSPSGLRSPDSITVGPDGLLYVLDSGNSIHVFDPVSGARIGTPITAGSGLISAGLSLDAAPDGHLYVLSNQGRTLLKIDPVLGNVSMTLDLSGYLTTPGSGFSPSILYLQVPEPAESTLVALGVGLLGWVTRSRSRTSSRSTR